MSKHSDKIILDLCGGTGSWSAPYVAAGYTVINATLPKYDVVRWREYPDLLAAVESGKVHGILAAPPCTMFSIARTRAKTPRNLRQGMAVVSACLDIIHEARLRGGLKWWALENPTGILRQFLGAPAMTFRQWQFGTNTTKSTDLWGYFNTPRATRRTPPRNLRTSKDWQGWTHPTIPAEFRHLTVREARAHVRAITPPGFAKAFAQHNV